MDFKLTTKRSLGVEPVPPQPTNPDEFFGESSNDLQWDPVNDVDTISGVDKLKQDINKILLTERGTNTNFPLYGSALQTFIGNKVNFQVLKAKVHDEVVSALQVLQFINKDNPNPDEKPDTLEFLSIEQPSVDQIEVKINVITESGKRLVTGIILNVPTA
jgi:hypothetical protein